MAVNQCFTDQALAMRGMLIMMGFPRDATIICLSVVAPADSGLLSSFPMY